MIGIEHIGIFSKNSEALKDWYIKLFGWKQVYADEKNKAYFVKADDGAMIEFCTAKEDGSEYTRETKGLRHIAISVDNFDEAVKKVKDSGAKILTEATINEDGNGLMFFEDPDGNYLHLIYRPVKF